MKAKDKPCAVNSGQTPLLEENVTTCVSSYQRATNSGVQCLRSHCRRGHSLSLSPSLIQYKEETKVYDTETRVVLCDFSPQ